MTDYHDARGEHDDTFRAPRSEDFVEYFLRMPSVQLSEPVRLAMTRRSPFPKQRIGRALRQVKPVIVHMSTPGLVRPSYIERHFKAGRPDA